MKAHGVKAGEYLTYVDGEKYAVQQQETATLYDGLISNPDIFSHKIAFFIPGALARLQIARVAPRDNHRFFTSEAEAMEWLLKDDD